METSWVSRSYLQHQVGGGHDKTCLLDTSFPSGESRVVVRAPDVKVDEDEPDDVENDGYEEDNHHDVFLSFEITPSDVSEEEHRQVVVRSSQTTDGSQDSSEEEEVGDERSRA